jgi:hypothetical protein
MKYDQLLSHFGFDFNLRQYIRGWATTALNFWASGGDIFGRFQTSSFSVSGVLDSRLGDPDRPYARIVAPVVAELPCVGVLRTVGSVFADIDGVFRLHAENVPMNISCGDGGGVRGERAPVLVASADLTLIIEPAAEFDKLLRGAQAKANQMDTAAKNALRDQIGSDADAAGAAASAAGGPSVDGGGDGDDGDKGSAGILRAASQMSHTGDDDNPVKYDDDGRFTIPFMKTINIKARHVRGPAGWFWDGALDATIGGAHSPLRVNANATFRTAEVGRQSDKISHNDIIRDDHIDTVIDTVILVSFSISILSFCHLVDRITRQYLVTL